MYIIYIHNQLQYKIKKLVHTGLHSAINVRHTTIIIIIIIIVIIIIIIIIMFLSDAASLGYDHMTPVHQDNIKCNYPQS